MFSHRTIWNAIDALAERHQLSASGLAKLAGLDSTAFNPSKRVSKGGRKRWPSTESIAKVLAATSETLDGFLEGSGEFHSKQRDRVPQSVPLLGLAEAGAGGYFDSAGFPSGRGWEEVPVPSVGDSGMYALEVSGEAMLPAYRDGTILLIAPNEQLRRGDRVVVRTTNGDINARVLHRRTSKSVELYPLNPQHERHTLSVGEVDWMARIVWASQ